MIVPLPLLEQNAAGGPPDPKHAEVNGQRVRILVVDDDHQVRMFVALVLRSAGYEVFEARSGEAAILLSQELQTPIDMVISDVLMPRVSGKQIVTRIRLRHPEVRFLLMSGCPILTSLTGEVILRPEALSTDPHFILKPFTPRHFVAKVREILDEPACTLQGSGA